MARLPKSIIKKYGISKKAWAVFRGTKRSTPASPRRKTHTHGGIMARRHYGKKIYRAAKKFAPTTQMMGALAYALLEPTIDQMTGSFGVAVPANIIKGVGGYMLAKKGGIVGGVGMAALTIEVYKLGRGGIGSLFGASASGGQAALT